MSLDNDINQNFQDAIDVIQQHSSSYYDSGTGKYQKILDHDNIYFILIHLSKQDVML